MSKNNLEVKSKKVKGKVEVKGQKAKGKMKNTSAVPRRLAFSFFLLTFALI